MAWCMNPNCGRVDLHPSEVVHDDELKMVLCLDCSMRRGSSVRPQVIDQQGFPFTYEFHLTSRDGFSAKFGFGEIAFGVRAPNNELKKLLGIKGS